MLQAIVMCACVALSTAQFGYPGFDNFFGTAYAAPSYGGLSAAARDPRANTGTYKYHLDTFNPSSSNLVWV